MWQHLFLLDLQTLKRQYLFHWTCRLMPCMVGPIRSGAPRPAHFASTPLRSVATELTPGSPAHWGPPSTFGLRLAFSIVWCHFMLGESVRRGYTYPGAPLKFDTNRPPYSHHHTCLWVLRYANVTPIESPKGRSESTHARPFASMPILYQLYERGGLLCCM